MSDLRTRLQRLKKGTPTGTQREGGDVISSLRAEIGRVMMGKGTESPAMSDRKGPEIDALVPGQTYARGGFDLFVAREDYDTGHLHGNNRLEEIYNVLPEVIGGVTTDEGLEQFHADGALFIDTETTGLSGGTGTYAFMVGIGFFDGGRFVVEQFLMRNQAEEAEMLALLGERLARSRFLVSFNGKSFDVPLLETRYILSRLDAELLQRPHLDLLYPARRIWKRSLQSCRLGNLETQLLGVERVGDVPGELIPGIYFDYLRTGNGSRLERVFYHNKLDILSMVTLTALVNRLLSDSKAVCRSDGLEQYSLGRIHLERGSLPEAEAAFLEALRACPYGDREWEIVKHLSITYKRGKEWEKAVKAWQDMIALDASRDIFPFIELAKYYEHQVKDYARAIDYTLQAREVPFLSPMLEAEMDHRIVRLQRKLESGDTNPV
ncbi:MAG: ribonuclease H-like domain-containing protein [bacterium]|nr:ribonuclease H-like domain-containing protein [bacterium]